MLSRPRTALLLIYVTDLLDVYIPGRCFRSSSVDSLWFSVPKMGEAAFFTEGPLLWNAPLRTVRATETTAGFLKRAPENSFICSVLFCLDLSCDTFSWPMDFRRTSDMHLNVV